MAEDDSTHLSQEAQIGWEAALLEIEHQAEHRATSEHADVGLIIAGALRSAAQIARAGGLRREHRDTGMVQAVLLRLASAKLARSAPPEAAAEPEDQSSSTG